MKKNGIAALVLFALSGCTTMFPNDVFSPEKAAAKIIKAESPQSHINVYPSNLGIYSTIFERAAVGRIREELERYCHRHSGDLIPFANDAPGFLCSIDPERGITFAARTDTNFGVIEKRAQDTETFDNTAESWGYVSLAHQAELINQARAKVISEQEKQRFQATNKQKTVGMRVCQEQGKVRYQGTVEQVNGNKIKVFVEQAAVIGAPELRPAGFRQESYWVNFWDVYDCE